MERFVNSSHLSDEAIFAALAQEDPELVELVTSLSGGMAVHAADFASAAQRFVDGRVRALALVLAASAVVTAGERGAHVRALLADACTLASEHLVGTTYEEAAHLAFLRYAHATADHDLHAHAQVMRARFTGYGYFLACMLEGEHALAGGDVTLARTLLALATRAKPDEAFAIAGLTETTLDLALESRGVDLAEIAAFRGFVRQWAREGACR